MKRDIEVCFCEICDEAIILSSDELEDDDDFCLGLVCDDCAAANDTENAYTGA